MIYFIQSENSGDIKIGYIEKDNLRAVHQRLDQFQIGNPSRLTVLAVMSGKIGKEKQIHQRFASARIQGEWFRSTPELLEFIQSQAIAETDAEKLLVKCPICQGSFLPSTSRHRVCSEVCRQKSLCIICGAAFVPECPWKRYYCSLECYYKGV